ncbi:MAG: lamin tail domain-containing protein [bacterium]|nr:lamin tail domain-containing protein [bacterium]
MVWSLRILGLITAVVILNTNKTSALSNSVLISQVQTGGIVSASEEFVELHNTSNEVINMSGWKLKYISSSGLTTKTIYDFDKGINKQSSILLVTDEYSITTFDFDDKLLSSGLASTGGHILLVDQNGNEVDRLGWGSSTQPETKPAGVSGKGEAMWRKIDADSVLIDTNNNFEDFEVMPSDPSFGGMIVIEDPTPEIFTELMITELFPNPSAALDSEGEFVELYSPYLAPINLMGYKLQTGENFQYEYVLPNIEILDYIAIYSKDSKLVLSNTSSKARLLDPSGNVIFETLTYTNVDEDESWALLDSWQVTNRPTPGQGNEKTIIVEVPVEEEPAREPCPEGKFRNPETNRCKSLASTTTVLKPCLMDQFRNPLTNRCKSLTSSTASLTPCLPNQIRNPETNRCKKLQSDSSELKPCNEDQERNPETNRCKKVLGVKTNTAEDVKKQTSKISWLVMAGMGAGALAFIIWEYRKDIKAKLTKKTDEV